MELTFNIEVYGKFEERILYEISFKHNLTEEKVERLRKSYEDSRNYDIRQDEEISDICDEIMDEVNAIMADEDEDDTVSCVSYPEEFMSKKED